MTRYEDALHYFLSDCDLTDDEVINATMEFDKTLTAAVARYFDAWDELFDAIGVNRLLSCVDRAIVKVFNMGESDG